MTARLRVVALRSATDDRQRLRLDRLTNKGKGSKP